MDYRNVEYVFVIGYNDNNQIDKVIKDCKKKYVHNKIIEATNIEDISSAVTFYNMEDNKSDDLKNPEYIIFVIDIDQFSSRLEALMDYYEDFMDMCYDEHIGSSFLIACNEESEIYTDEQLSYILKRIEHTTGEDLGMFDGVPNREDIYKKHKEKQDLGELELLEEISKNAEIDLDIQSFGSLIDSYIQVEPLLNDSDKSYLSAQISISLHSLMNELTKKYHNG